MGILIGVGVVIILIGAWCVGLIMGMSREVTEDLKKVGLTKADLRLYRQAGKILNRLVNVTELDGDLATDIVSERTRQTITEWLDAYKKEIDKV